MTGFLEAKPHWTDTDDDGLPDNWEVEHGLNPEDPVDASLDYDADELTNGEEAHAGTDALAADTDADGLDDAEESVLETNPLAYDTDGDGLRDGDEVDVSLTDPLAADGDGDGADDGTEVQAGTDPGDGADAGARLQGAVVELGGRALEGALVRALGGPETHSRRDGSFELFLRAGPYALEASLEGYRPERQTDVDLLPGDNHVVFELAGIPAASFEAEPREGTAPLEVRFRSTSLGTIAAYEWSFGDGGASTERDPVHVYWTPGDYDVTLRVSGPAGESTHTEGGAIRVKPLVAFLRGDCNSDGALGLSDAIFELAYLFLGGEEPSCHEACDANGDGAVGISDAIYALSFLFLGGPSLPPPFPSCGTGSLSLGCVQHSCQG
ncbi:MAG: PKD domain-containing protein [Planctomycetes bacterium]|nr:PKD domain-containing protein [Planctomycetota bacterium]